MSRMFDRSCMEHMAKLNGSDEQYITILALRNGTSSVLPVSVEVEATIPKDNHCGIDGICSESLCLVFNEQCFSPNAFLYDYRIILYTF